MVQKQNQFQKQNLHRNLHQKLRPILKTHLKQVLRRKEKERDPVLNRIEIGKEVEIGFAHRTCSCTVISAHFPHYFNHGPLCIANQRKKMIQKMSMIQRTYIIHRIRIKMMRIRNKMRIRNNHLTNHRNHHRKAKSKV